MTDPLQAWREALAEGDRVQAMRRAAQDRLAAGTEKAVLQAELEQLRIELQRDDRDADEDAVLDVLDMLTGWTHPDLKL